MTRRLFTSESVTEGHPDKIADQISDSILDALLAQDPQSRVAVETLITTGQVHVAGEVTTEAYADIPAIVRETHSGDRLRLVAEGLRRARRAASASRSARSRPTSPRASTAAYEARVEGSEDAVDRSGRGRPGPDVRLRLRRHARADAAADLAGAPAGRAAHRGAQGGVVPYLRPDGKTQVTIEYDGDKPVRLDTIVISSQHAEDIDLDTLAQAGYRGARRRRRCSTASTSTPTATGCWSTRPAGS